MTEEQFTKLRNFSYDELIHHYMKKGCNKAMAGVEIAKIDVELFNKLQKVRTVINCSINLNSITDGGHVAGSYHYMGLAVDWYPGDPKIHPNKILQACLTVGFKGIGWYPGWRWPGFHTDIGNRAENKIWKRIDGDYKPVIGEGS